MTDEEMQMIVSPEDQLHQLGQRSVIVYQQANVTASAMAQLGAALSELKPKWDRSASGNWTDHLEREIAGGRIFAHHCMKLATIPELLNPENVSTGNISTRAWRALAYAPDPIKEGILEQVRTGETFTAADVKAARDAAKAEAQQDASATIIAKEKAVAKLKAQIAALAQDDKAAVAADLAAQLDAERAARVKAEAIAEAAAKNLTVAPPKVIVQADPEQAARLVESERKAADLSEQLRKAREMLKARDSQIARADETAIRMAGERLANSAPSSFVNTFCGDVTAEYLRRLRGAVSIARRAPHLFTPELTIPLAEVRDLLDAIADACSLVDAA